MSILAVDIGGTSVKYALWQAESLQNPGNFQTPDSWSALQAELLRVLGEQAKQSPEEIEAVTISVPGAVDSEAGVIGGYSAISYIHHFPFVTELEAALGKPVFIENDANCAGLAEAYYGAAKDAQSSVALIIGSGVGGAVILERHLIKGNSLFGGEFGYMLTEKGHTLSELASPVHAAKRYAKAMALAEAIDGQQLFALAEKGDERAQKEVAQIHRVLAIGIYNICLVIDPEVVCIGGGISTRSDLLEPVKEQLAQLQAQQHAEDQAITVKICEFQKDANLVGAVANYHLRKDQ